MNKLTLALNNPSVDMPWNLPTIILFSAYLSDADTLLP